MEQRLERDTPPAASEGHEAVSTADTLIAEVNAALAAKNEAGEGGSFAFRQRLVDLETRLGAVDMRPLPQARLAAARIAMRLGKWETAIARWTRVLQDDPDTRAEAHLGLAKAHAELKAFDAAREHVDAARTAGARKSTVDRLAARLSGKEDIQFAARLADRGYAELKVGRLSIAAPLLQSAAIHLGREADQVAQIGRDFAVLADALDNRLPDAAEAATAPPPSPRKIFVAGLGWSGSGAVTDHIREFDVSSPFMTEANFFVRAEHWLRPALEKADPSRLVDALGYFSAYSLHGVTQSYFGKTRFKMVIARAIMAEAQTAKQRDDCGTAFASLVQELFSAMREDRVSPSVVTAALQRYFDGALASLAPESRPVLINNAIKGYDLSALRNVRNARAVVVFRDPRDQAMDQFVKRSNASDGEAFLEKFQEKVMGHLLRTRKALEDPEVAAVTDVVRFEDFVTSATLRRKLTERLGLSEDDRTGAQHFFPEVSAGNIGIHRAFPDPGAMDALAAALAPFSLTPTLEP